MIVLQVLFWISLAGIIHTYVLYPAIMLLSDQFKKPKISHSSGQKKLPSVEIIFAAYNEESVIEEKIRSSFETSYPSDKLTVRVGTDHCSDKTDEIIRELQSEFPGLILEVFTERTGKSQIINQLVADSNAEQLILTDANVFFTKDTIPELVQSLMKDTEAGIAGGKIIYKDVDDKGISKQENTYLKLENRIKKAESDLFSSVMGVEGGCYIIRRDLFPPIPPLFFMEDFFVSMAILEKGYNVLFNERAVCYEDVSVINKEEYKRKVRISIGNFQNLHRFKNLVINKFYPVGFAFLSHKILRWVTPLFLVFLLISSAFLASENRFFSLFAGIYFLFLSAGLLGIVFSHEKGSHWIKYPGHFIYMNFALLKGFFIYLKGVKTNVWQPTSRNQQ